MLEILNRYANGLAAIPVLSALNDRGCIDWMQDRDAFSGDEATVAFTANGPYLQAALRMLHCLEWLRLTPEGRYRATPAIEDCRVVPTDIMELYGFPFEAYVAGRGAPALDQWLDRSARRWDTTTGLLADSLDGLLIVPLLLELRAQRRLEVVEHRDGDATTATAHVHGHSGLSLAVERLFAARGWLEPAAGELRLNRAGRFVIDRVLVTATMASYRPMFRRMQALLFGDAAAVLQPDAAGHETHVDRTLNVIASGFQHDKYFSALSELVVSVFDHEDYSSQPRYIADMGCGDGSLLRRLFETVRDRTCRGRVLARYPLVPIAIDYSDQALAVASQTLRGIDHIALRGDIGDPQRLVRDLRARGIDALTQVLHVRSFLDHNRPYAPPASVGAAESRSRFGGSGIYIAPDGATLAPRDVIQSTVEHLRRWSEIVDDHGLFVLEVHCMPPEATAKYLDQSESFHFDFYHGLSHQHLVEANTFVACAAEAGLFAASARRFPEHLPFTRITLNHFTKKPFTVRHATAADVPALRVLHDVPRRADDRGGDHAAAPPDVRLRQFPAGQFVLEIGPGIVAAVGCVFEEGRGVRIACASVASAVGERHLPDLLRFVEQYWALTPDIGPVAGVDAFTPPIAPPSVVTSLAGAVAGDVAAKRDSYACAPEHDPREAERELAVFSFRWLLAHLQRMGVMRQPGETYDLPLLKERLGIASKYHRYFDAVMRKLQAEHLVAIDGARVRTLPRVRGYALSDVDKQVSDFIDTFQIRHPGTTGLLNVTAACLRRYEEIVTGRVDVTEVLFANGNTDVFAQLFRGGAVADYFNRLVADAVLGAVTRLQGRRHRERIRILEIGAGTGGTTTTVLDAIAPYKYLVNYCFSDISFAFVRQAKRRFAERYPWLDYRSLNIEEDLSLQGFEAHDFDIIIAANALHDTRDIVATLAQTRRLLQPGGVLVLNEYTTAKECLWLSGALLHGWWLFEDPERRLADSCLMSVPQWTHALRDAGFADVRCFALPTQRADADCTQTVILAGSPAMPSVADTAPMSVAASTITSDRDHRLAAGGAIAKVVDESILSLLGAERASEFHPERGVMEMGLDSIELVELKVLLEQHFGVTLSAMFLFQQDTPQKISTALAQLLPKGQTQSIETGEPGEPHPSPGDQIVTVSGGPTAGDAVAVIGIACRFPGGAVSPAAFWTLLERGQSAIGWAPTARWAWPVGVDPATTHRGLDRGAFLERIDEFDAEFFGISPQHATRMDPQERLLLELIWEAIEDAGHRPRKASGRRVGVFVGACHSDYDEVLAAASDSTRVATGHGSAHMMLAMQLADRYDFTGPRLTCDMACASALFALHHATSALTRGDCEQALVGAVNLLCSPTTSVSYYEAGMLSRSGSCRTFDEHADGYVRGEGAAMLLLKPLGAALRDGDAVYGLIKATAVNNGGQSVNAVTSESQAAVIEAAWHAAGVMPDSAGYIESHGLGARRGDAVEVKGIVEAFARLYRAHGRELPTARRCGLGAVKTNIGHLEGAAGLAGVIKVLLAIEHGRIPRTLNFERLNSDIDLANRPFHVVADDADWPAPSDEHGHILPRHAGVSAFGFGGANAHVVIGEHRPVHDHGDVSDHEYLIPLSARNQRQLIDQARRLLAYLAHPRASASLRDIAYTLQIGRDTFAERVAFVVRSRDDLISALRRYVARGQHDPTAAEDTSGATADADASDVESGVVGPDLRRTARHWMKGLEVSWAHVSSGAHPRRVHLPTYPFGRARHWPSERSVDAVMVETPSVTAGGEIGVLNVLRDAWRCTLDVDDIGLDERLFTELGAESVHVMRVLASVTRDLCVTISPHMLLAGQTIRRQGERIGRALRTHIEDGPLIRLNAGEPGRMPFVLVHGADGHAFNYVRLVRRMDPLRPMYALISPRLDPDVPFTPFAAAHTYRDCLQRELGGAPFVLGGWSYGAVLAIQIAEQLEDTDGPPAALILFDVAPISPQQARRFARCFPIVESILLDGEDSPYAPIANRPWVGDFARDCFGECPVDRFIMGVRQRTDRAELINLARFVFPDNRACLADDRDDSQALDELRRELEAADPDRFHQFFLPGQNGRQLHRAALLFKTNVVEACSFAPHRRLSSPILAMCATGTAGAERWEALTSGGFTSHHYPIQPLLGKSVHASMMDAVNVDLFVDDLRDYLNVVDSVVPHRSEV